MMAKRKTPNNPNVITADQTVAGLRYDQAKPRFDLLPPEAQFALAQLYTIGAEKYPERNWEKGMRWGRCFAAMLRHTWKWWGGEDLDPETGLHHMIHVAWNAITLYTYTERAIGEDDRPTSQS